MTETNLYTATIPAMISALSSLSGLLDKAEHYAEARKSDVTNLLNDRLVFDQFAFIRQVQITCDNAKGLAARVAQVENPKHADTETSIPELKARIEKTIAFLQSITPEQVVGNDEKEVTLPYFPGKHFLAGEYAFYYALPNFYFHYTTAYAILRKNGVELGKADFINLNPILRG